MHPEPDHLSDDEFAELCKDIKQLEKRIEKARVRFDFLKRELKWLQKHFDKAVA